MAREYARIRTDLWADDHWRQLSPGAQWLYEYLLACPSLSGAGVADWRPARIAKLARGLTREQISMYAAELVKERFILVDDATEEVLVRTFLRHDGVMLNPNMWKGVGIAYADIYSPALKSAVSHEARRLRNENPDGFTSEHGRQILPWASKYLQTMLNSGSNTPSDTPSDTPSKTPSDTGSGVGSDRGPSPTPTPTPKPEASLPAKKKRELRLPKDWAPNAEHVKRAADGHLDLAAEAESFRLHAETHDRHAANWNAAFTTWLKKARPAAAASPSTWIPPKEPVSRVCGKCGAYPIDVDTHECPEVAA